MPHPGPVLPTTVCCNLRIGAQAYTKARYVVFKKKEKPPNYYDDNCLLFHLIIILLYPKNNMIFVPFSLSLPFPLFC
jgi:hypothetical protein